MSNIVEKNIKIKDYKFRSKDFSKMFTESKIVKGVRKYFTNINSFENEEKNRSKKDSMIFDHHINISPQETWARYTIRMNIR